jgi:hypothetical protein
LPPLRSFFRRRRWVDYLFDCRDGKLSGARPPARLAGGPSWFLGEAQLDQAADGLGAVGFVFFSPPIDGDSERGWQSNGADGVAARRRPTSLFLVYLN